MEYMESKMQDHYDAGEAMADLIFEQMARFEYFYLSLPDSDETLLEEKDNYFDYKNETVQFMWACFRRGAGV
jgi:hypothetical protein